MMTEEDKLRMEIGRLRGEIDALKHIIGLKDGYIEQIIRELNN